MKKTAIFISVLFLYSFCFSQSSKNLKQFIRGNIQDKISSIRNASQEENVSISLMALDFCLQNKAVLEDEVLVTTKSSISLSYSINGLRSF